MIHLDPDETILLEVRKHWIVFVSYGLVLVIGALLPLIVWAFVAGPVSAQLPADLNTEALFAFVYTLWLLVLWIGFFVQWTNYYLNVWYVTEKRIIDVEQKGIFDREVSSIRFDKIQDITTEVRGVIATFLNFGDVQVETASETGGDFKMKTAANPDDVRGTVFSQHNQQAERTQPVRIVSGGEDSGGATETN